MKYALVVAGSPEMLSQIRHGSLVTVRPSSQAFYQGVPAPELVPNNDKHPDSTLLGTALRPPMLAGANSGTTLAVVSLTVAGAADIHVEASAALPRLKRWAMWRNRRVLVLPAEHKIILK